MEEKDVIAIIQKDPERMRILRAVASLNLSDWWIGAGFVRNAVWDELFGNGRTTPLNDVDIAYWKPLSSYGMPEQELLSLIRGNLSNPVWEEEQVIAKQLSDAVPGFMFEAKNQARMHEWVASEYVREPYTSAAHAIADWSETATGVGVRMNTEGEVEFLATHGLSDLVQGIVRPTRPEIMERVRTRAKEKHWFELWPALRFEDARPGTYV